MKIGFKQIGKTIDIDINKLKELGNKEIEKKLREITLLSFCEGGDTGGAYGTININGEELDQNDLFRKEEESEKILVCSKCGGTEFTPTGGGWIYTVYIENGTPPSTNNYRCAACGNIESVYYPAVYNDVEPQEVELPKVKVIEDKVKMLREMTGCGIMDCKHALTRANDDIEKAKDILKEMGSSIFKIR